MFGYVTPCKMELKIKDYEKFKAYYCGLCKAIKSNYGNLPRAVLNYDMTFLAVLLDSIQDIKCNFNMERCFVHPMNKKLVIINNDALNYSAFINIALSYHKLLDDADDDNSKKSKMLSILLHRYIAKAPDEFNEKIKYISEKLKQLYRLESAENKVSLDELSHPFAELTAYLLSTYIESYEDKESLYWLGYNLGKWIYIIDAWDDLEADMKKNKFNAIASILNESGLPYEGFSKSVEARIDFLLVTCAEQCLQHLNRLTLYKNNELLNNILQLGLMEKMDKVFKRSEPTYEESL